MDDKIIVDLAGLNLSDDEKEQLQSNLQTHVMGFLQGLAKPAPSPITALGPGWIGIETRDD